MCKCTIRSNRNTGQLCRTGSGSGHEGESTLHLCFPPSDCHHLRISSASIPRLMRVSSPIYARTWMSWMNRKQKPRLSGSLESMPSPSAMQGNCLASLSIPSRRNHILYRFNFNHSLSLLTKHCRFNCKHLRLSSNYS